MKIALIGQLRSGKTTVMNMIFDIVKDNPKCHDVIAAPLGFPIYEEAKAFYKRNGLVWKKDRELLQAMGRALNEESDDGQDRIVQKWHKAFEGQDNLIVEDCRRTTQVEYLKSQGFIVIKIKCEDEIRKSRCKPGEWSEGHVTDIELLDYNADYEITNNGTEKELKDNVSSILSLIFNQERREL